MFSSRNINSKIRSLKIANEDYTSCFEQLLEIDGFTNIHQRNLRAPATEMYKVSNNLSPLFMRELFSEENQYLQY